MNCLECKRLEGDLTRLERLHAEAVDKLISNSETAPPQEYSVLRIRASEAHLNVEIARLEFDRHRSHASVVNMRPVLTVATPRLRIY